MVNPPSHYFFQCSGNSGTTYHLLRRIQRLSLSACAGHIRTPLLSGTCSSAPGHTSAFNRWGKQALLDTVEATPRLVHPTKAFVFQTVEDDQVENSLYRNTPTYHHETRVHLLQIQSQYDQPEVWHEQPNYREAGG